MAKVAGRKVTIWDTSGTATLIAGGREHGITVNGELLDATDKGSDGWRDLIADVGVRSVDISFSGLLDGDVMIDLALGTTTALLFDCEVRIDGVGVMDGNWGFDTLEINSPHDGLTEQNFTLKSNGPITWTAS